VTAWRASCRRAVREGALRGLSAVAWLQDGFLPLPTEPGFGPSMPSGLVQVIIATARSATPISIAASQPNTTMSRSSEQTSIGRLRTSEHTAAPKRDRRGPTALGRVRRRLSRLRHETRENPLAMLRAPGTALLGRSTAEQLHSVPWPAQRKTATCQPQLVQSDAFRTHDIFDPHSLTLQYRRELARQASSFREFNRSNCVHSRRMAVAVSRS
jgi:hypothetical protein